MTEEQKTEEHHAEHKVEHKQERMKLSVASLGKSPKQVLENISFLIIVISAIAVSVGIGIGSFIQGTVILAVIGSFFVMVGIVIYIASQFIGVENG